MDVEDVFSSRIRVRILKILAQTDGLDDSEIVRRLDVSHETIDRHLKTLEEESLIQHKVSGRTRLYRINEHPVKAKAVQNLMEVWERFQ